MKILTTFLHTLNRGDKKTELEKKFSFLKCIKKSNVFLKNFGFLVFSIYIWYLAYPTNRLIRYLKCLHLSRHEEMTRIPKIIKKQKLQKLAPTTYLLDVLWCQQIKPIQVVSTSEFHEY